MLRSVPEEEIDGKWIPKYHAEDRPARLADQLTWMSEIGFSEKKTGQFRSLRRGTKHGGPTTS